MCSAQECVSHSIQGQCTTRNNFYIGRKKIKCDSDVGHTLGRFFVAQLLSLKGSLFPATKLCGII